jgi:hypothetical protein
MTFSTVNTARLQAAFHLATRAAEDYGTSIETRKKFRAIARLIWDAHGEQGPAPTVAELEAAISRRKQAGR